VLSDTNLNLFSAGASDGVYIWNFLGDVEGSENLELWANTTKVNKDYIHPIIEE
jgi:hypothetical protein